MEAEQQEGGREKRDRFDRNSYLQTRPISAPVSPIWGRWKVGNDPPRDPWSPKTSVPKPNTCSMNIHVAIATSGAFFALIIFFLENETAFGKFP
jgi:hypothetical protein